MSKLKILFIDDELPILNGLERSLRRHREEWKMVFFEHPKEALHFLKDEEMDVLVSDMRMPEMNGNAFLERAARIQPGTVRIILSGYSDRELAMESVKHTHISLNKPCELEDLTTLFKRLAFLYALPVNRAMREKLTSLNALPVFPATYQRIVGVLREPDCSIKEVGEIIAQDLAMTTKILQLVNSAFFGISRRITRVTDAASLLGLETIKALVLGFGVFSQFEDGRIDPKILNRLTRHSLNVGMLACGIGKSFIGAPEVADEAFMAGVLHDLGKLALLTNYPEEYTQVLKMEQEEQEPLCSLEQNQIGIHHCLVGAFLTGIWGLPMSVMNATAFHHAPSDSPTPHDCVLAAVHVADAMLNAHEPRTKHPAALDTDYLDRQGWLEILPEWEELHKKILSTGC